MQYCCLYVSTSSVLFLMKGSQSVGPENTLTEIYHLVNGRFRIIVVLTFKTVGDLCGTDSFVLSVSFCS